MAPPSRPYHEQITAYHCRVLASRSKAKIVQFLTPLKTLGIMKKFMQFQRLIGFFMLTASSASIAQQIEICGVQVSIGDEREAVEKAFIPRCRVMRHPTEKMTIYWDSLRPNDSSQGHIYYQADRVKSASPPASHFQDSADPVAVISAFTQALQIAHDSAGLPTRISTSVLPFSDAKMTVLQISFEGRSVSVLVKEGGKEDGQYVSISESIVAKD
jgi:hypothetical protein